MDLSNVSFDVSSVFHLGSLILTALAIWWCVNKVLDLLEYRNARLSYYEHFIGRSKNVRGVDRTAIVLRSMNARDKVPDKLAGIINRNLRKKVIYSTRFYNNSKRALMRKS